MSYRDGRLEESRFVLGGDSNGGVAPAANTRDVFIGKAFGGGTAQRRFTGLIDEVEYFNRALNPSEGETIVDAGRRGKCKPSSTPTTTPPTTHSIDNLHAQFFICQHFCD